jgi:hypothetical protein
MKKTNVKRKTYFLYPEDIKKVARMAKIRTTKVDKWTDSRVIRELINKE